MPLYAYRCNNCRNEFETRQRFSDDPLTECPVCEGEIRRVINQVGVVFKGSGFYVTDNKSKNPAAPKTSDSGSESADKSANGSEGSKTKGDGDKKAAKSTSPAKSEAKAEKSST